MILWRAGAAVIGFAIAVVLAPYLQWRASASELPGAMQAKGLDPSGPMLQLAFIVALTFIFAAAAGYVAPALSRRFPPERRRHIVDDSILLATLLPLYFAFLDLSRGDPHWLLVAAAAVVAALRFLVPPSAFAIAPLAILLQLGLMSPRPAAIAAVAWIIATPLFLRRVDLRRIIPRVYAVFVFTYPLALLGVTTTPYLDFFEDGHELVVANELTHGERPYADIVPVHGLISDGGFDALIGGHSANAILRARRVLSALNLVAIYAVVLAASGSAHLGLLAVFLAIGLVPSATIWLRTIPALFALAATCAAIRLRARRWLAVAGVLVVVAFLFGMDFGVYSAVVAAIAAWRMRALRPLFAAIFSASVVVAILFALGHFATPFLRTTIFEILPAGPVYVPGPLQLPPDRIILALWIVALIFAAAMTRRRIRRTDAVWAVALWAVVAALSYAQRRHTYAAFVIPAFVVLAIWLIARRQRFVAAAAAIVALVIAHPLNHVFAVATPLRLAGGAKPGGNPIVAGVVVTPEVGRGIESARQFVARALPPDATWFDFSNSPSLYFLLDRRCPTRHHQVPFYESAEEQRDVIAALERDTSIHAALIACPGGDNAIDGVPNHIRAPLVWQYLQTHFAPAYAANGVVFWMRRASGSAPTSAPTAAAGRS